MKSETEQILFSSLRLKNKQAIQKNDKYITLREQQNEEIAGENPYLRIRIFISKHKFEKIEDNKMEKSRKNSSFTVVISIQKRD